MWGPQSSRDSSSRRSDPRPARVSVARRRSARPAGALKAVRAGGVCALAEGSSGRCERRPLPRALPGRPPPARVGQARPSPPPSRTCPPQDPDAEHHAAREGLAFPRASVAVGPSRWRGAGVPLLPSKPDCIVTWGDGRVWGSGRPHVCGQSRTSASEASVVAPASICCTRRAASRPRPRGQGPAGGPGVTFRQTQLTESLGALPQPPGLSPRWRSEPWRATGPTCCPRPRTVPGPAGTRRLLVR